MSNLKNLISSASETDLVVPFGEEDYSLTSPFQELDALSREHETEVLIDAMQQVFARKATECPPNMRGYYTRIANALTELYYIAQ